MIQIIKRTIEVDNESFIKELKDFCSLMKKHAPNTIGIGVKSINNHFGVKLNVTDFYLLSDELNLKVYSGKWWYVKDILEK